MKVLLIEPPKKFWFVMGEYLPPPYNLLLLAAVIEQQLPDVTVKVIDSQAESLDWFELEEVIRREKPDIVGSGSHATCNVYKSVRILDMVKRVNPEIITIAGGSHFTMLDDVSLKEYPNIDLIVRYEGEKALIAVLTYVQQHGFTKEGLKSIKGISFIQNEKFYRTEDHPPLTGEELDALPYPAYHMVPLEKYHFAMMSDKPYVILEGARGCTHDCSFCSQQVFYRRHFATKSVQRIADEMEWMYNKLGRRFFWFADDNFCNGSPKLIEDLCKEMSSRGITGENCEWFAQMRVDSILNVGDNGLASMNRAGNYWQLVGAESPFTEVLDLYHKGIVGSQTIEAISLLKKNNILAQLMLVLGHENETRESIQETMRWATDIVRPDLTITMLLTPYPGTPMYKELLEKNRIVDFNWTNYDMIHGVCDMKFLTAKELQEELYLSYRHVFDSWTRRIAGILSRNKYKRRIYMYYMRAGVIGQLKKLIP
ncbi:MAG: B12-binding domain-containing radical SAM protein [Candidatus Hodarchaeales archaeon]